MKKYASVFALYARSTMYRSLAVTLLGGAAQVLLLLLRLKTKAPALPEDCITGSGAGIALMITFLLLTAVLCVPGAAPGTKYTLSRLRVSEGAAFWLHTLSNAVIYLFFWAAEIAVFAGFTQYFIAARSPAAGAQALFLATYRTDLFHSLLPLRDWVLWLRNGLFIVSLSLACAETPFLARRKRYSFTGVPAAALVCVFFVRGLRDRMKLSTAVMLLIVLLVKVIADFMFLEEDDA